MDKIIHDGNKYRELLKEKFGEDINKLDPIKKKFVHLTMVSDMIDSQCEIFIRNFREASNNEDVERISHLFLITLQHMDMLHDKIKDIHEKYIKDSMIIQSFDDKVLMISWMNIIVISMHITQSLLPMLNIMNSNDIHIIGDHELTEHFKEFLSLMKYMTNMSEEFENYINKNMH